MTRPSVSLIIVSWHRPALLARCLTAVAQLEDVAFGLTVVACAQGQGVVQAHDLAPRVTLLPAEAPGISAARNLGLARARGAIVAFLDDDAVPEPTWLAHLTRAFQDPDVQVAGGPVLGRNGISLQWGARWLDAGGQSHDAPGPGRVARVEGTNMAWRTNALRQIGGFDPIYRFYHDETDAVWRAAQMGMRVAHVPDAVVHHAQAAGPFRRADRVPRDLFEIARSQALFLRRHGPPDAFDTAWQAFHAEQMARLVRHLQSGAIGPEEMQRLKHSMTRGLKDGLAQDLNHIPPLAATPAPDTPVLYRPAAQRVLIRGWSWQARRLDAMARQHLAKGDHVTVLRQSPTALYHHMRFHPAGYWLQTGGLWGRSRRDDPLWRPASGQGRAQEEADRIAVLRADAQPVRVVSATQQGR